MAKAKGTTGNPFLDGDFGSVMDFSKFTEQFKLPGVDSSALAEYQRRNLEAFTKANQIAFAGIQAVAQRQSEILRQAMDGATKSLGEYAAPEKPADAWTKQAELVKEAYELALANMQELTEMSAKANGEAADLLTHRVSDCLDEMKDVFQPAKAATNGSAAKAAK